MALEGDDGTTKIVNLAFAGTNVFSIFFLQFTCRYAIFFNSTRGTKKVSPNLRSCIFAVFCWCAKTFLRPLLILSSS